MENLKDKNNKTNFWVAVILVGLIVLIFVSFLCRKEQRDVRDCGDFDVCSVSLENDGAVSDDSES